MLEIYFYCLICLYLYFFAVGVLHRLTIFSLRKKRVGSLKVITSAHKGVVKPKNLEGPE